MIPVPENVRWEAVLPQCILGISMLIVLVQEVLGAGRRSEYAAVTALGGTGLALGAVLSGSSMAQPAFSGTTVHDGLFRVFGTVILLALLLALLMVGDHAERQGHPHRSEQYALFLASGLGMLLMVGAVNLSLVFLGLELFSLALYLLCIFPPDRSTAQEAAMKYFLLSSFASAVMLFGFALLYGGSGSLDLARLQAATIGPGQPLLVVGMVLVLLGLCFKLAVVPFHMWAPDVYQGASTPVAAFMSVATKTAALAVLVRLFPLALPGLAWEWQRILAGLAILTMLVGNLGALAQRNVKRMLAWSSVAHAGYLLLAPIVMASHATGSQRGLEALLFYLLVYAFMNLGAFALVAWLENREGLGMALPALAGLGSRQPAVALGVTLLMMSLAGIPPAGGFFAKLFLFGAAVSTGWPLLAVIGVLGSLIGAYYYMRVVLTMYLGDSERPPLPPMDRGVAVVFWVCVVGVLLTGVLAQVPLTWFELVAGAAMGG